MAEAVSRLGDVRDHGVWQTTKVAFLASALIFLVTIVLGFLNIVTSGPLPRWQVLVHLHSGTLGWITLSMIGAAIWLFAANRTVSAGYAGRVRLLVWLAILAFVALIASFGLASQAGGGIRILLGVFGPVASLVVWAAAILFALELSRIDGPTTAQWLVASGLVAAGVATTMGALMATAVAGLVPFPPELAIIGHVIAIEGYLFLVAAGVIEWIVLGQDAGRRSGAGMIQVIVGLVIALLGPALVVLAIGGVGQATLMAIANLGLLSLILIYGLLFLVRVGATSLSQSPLNPNPQAWMFFASLWLVVGAIMWPVRAALGDPNWWILAYAHIIFVGLLTNSILGVLSARTGAAPRRAGWSEPVGMWLANIGIVVFLGLEITVDTPHGAWIMGAGVLLAVLTMGLALQRTSDDATASAVSGPTD